MTKKQKQAPAPLKIERKTTLRVPAALIEQIVRAISIGSPTGGCSIA